MNITIGNWVNGEKPVRVNLETLLASRMLITANSGGGKSYCLRGQIEAMAGHVQQVLIDTDGEFASLREKFDFVICAPKGGDAVAHPKTAALLCRKLLETKVSAIIDISELVVKDRHQFVRIFLETLMNLGKQYWSPLVLHLDEAHIYCPEKGQGESEASEAVIDLACRGRKRGFCLVAATQRLSKLRKDAAAELLNRLIGRTGLDVDVKRAAFELGMAPAQAQQSLPHMEPGSFFAYGPAIARTIQMMQTIEVQTTHPKPGVARVKDLPKPTPAVKAVLPQLADLQKESEEEARTLQDLRNQVSQQNHEMRGLRRELEKAQAAPAPKADPQQMQALRAKVRQLQSVVGALMKFVVKVQTTGYDDSQKALIGQAVQDAVSKVMARVESVAESHRKKIHQLQDEAKAIVQRAEALLDEKVELEVHVQPQPATNVRVRERTVAPLKEEGRVFEMDSGGGDPNFQPTDAQRRILNALAWLEHKGIEVASKDMLSAVAKYRGGAYRNNLGALRTAGAIAYVESGVCLTTMGRAHAHHPGNDGRSLADHWLSFVTNPQRKILEALIEVGEPMYIDELSEKIEYRGGAFRNNIGALTTMGAIYRPAPGKVTVTRNVVP